MSEISNEMKNAIKTAIGMEKDGNLFYNIAQERIKDKNGREMFKFLAEEELKHIDQFSAIFDDVLGDTKWREDAEKSTEGVSPLVKKLEDRLNKNKEESEIEALRIGMELERSAIEFYQTSSAKAQDPKVKEAFTKISYEEENHYQLFQAQYDSVTKMGFWFDHTEFQLESGY